MKNKRGKIVSKRASANAKVQYWTPNKFIYSFPYANEVALDECAKRGIDVMFGWEMLEVKFNEINQKIAVFRNVDTGEVIEKDFASAAINPASKPHQFLVDAGLTDAQGGVDVNRYTLQHNKHENIFAFGDCIGGETTRTNHAAFGQAPIVKNNVLKYLHGQDCNAIHDGYSYFPLWLGHQYTTSFAHYHDFEPHNMNHAVPHYGIFSRIHYGRMLAQTSGEAKKFTAMDKNHGPPAFRYMYSVEYDTLENNEILQARGLTPADVRHPNQQARIDSGSAVSA